MTLTQILQKIRSVFYTKAEIDASLSEYLPLSGGQMTSYNVMGRNVTNSHLQITGGTYDRDGAFLSLAGKDFSHRPGAFFMVARTADKVSYLQGTPDGSLTWNGKDIDVIDSQGNGYIRYSNGIQICWGRFSGIPTTNKTITFQKPFVYWETIAISFAGQNHSTVVMLAGWSITEFVVGASADIDTDHIFVWQAIGRWK